MSETDPPLSRGETLTLVGLVAAVIYALYQAVVWLVHTVVGVAIKGWAVLKAALAAAGLMVVGVLLGALLLDGLFLAASWLARGWRVKREIGRSSLPRYETYAGYQSPSSWLEAWLLGLVSGALERHYGQGARVDEAAFSSFVARRLGGLVRRPENRARFESKVVGPLYSRLQQGEPALEKWIERWGSRRVRRPLWILCRTVNLLLLGRLGWGAGEVWTVPDQERIKSDPAAFGRFVWESGWAGITAIETLLASELALQDGEWKPPRMVASGSGPADGGRPSSEPRRQAWPLALPAVGGTAGGAAMSGGERPSEEEVGLRVEAATEAELEADALQVVDGVLGLLHRDGEWWQEPGGLLEEISGDLLLAAAHHPEPTLVHELRSQVQGMQARLGEFGEWFRAQMEGPHEAWSPVMREALSQVSEPSAAVVERSAVRCFLHAGLGGPADVEEAVALVPVAVIDERPDEPARQEPSEDAVNRVGPQKGAPVLVVEAGAGAGAGAGADADLAAGVF